MVQRKIQVNMQQLDRYLKFIGKTEGKFPLRMKEPQKSNLIGWLDKRGVSQLFVQVFGDC